MGSRRALFDEEHEAFRDSFATFVQRDAAPAESLAKVFAAAGRNGFLGMQVPDELGGAGVDDPRFGVVAVEEFLNAGMSGEGLAFATHVGVAIPVMLRHGSDEQRGRWLPAMASGDCVAGVVETPVRFSPLIGGGRLDGMATGVVNGASAGLLLVPADSRWGERLVVLVDPNAAGVRRSNGPAPLGMLGSGSCDVDRKSVV